MYFSCTCVVLFSSFVSLLGGITLDNALKYLQVHLFISTCHLSTIYTTTGCIQKAGATHIIITSYVFCDGAIAFDRLTQLCELVTKLVNTLLPILLFMYIRVHVCMYACMYL